MELNFNLKELIIVSPPSYLISWKSPKALVEFAPDAESSVTLYCAYTVPAAIPVPPADGSKL